MCAQLGCSHASAHHASLIERNVLQTRLTYQHPSGVRRMRIATKATYWADSGTNPQGMGFSANTSAIVFARWLAYEASRGASARELSTWLDRQLVSLTQRSASFKEGDTDSVVLPGELSSFPELVFHIRRSTFLNYFGNAPDETVFYRSLLFRCCFRYLSRALVECSSG